ncbi:MAG TPA: DUF2071 domain-containing protein [Acidimicrobiales bacterium]|nr:DUF2071 domain-containing protein [Acidimicrobiales bacterium]
MTRQAWRTMTFLHWSYEPSVVQALLPDGFEADTFDGRAWVGMTPFVMSDFRLGPIRGVPGLSTFPETNVRTYARGPDGRDGLWFFSLEAASLPLVVGASTLYGVPYRWAAMGVDRGDTVRYRSRRRVGAPLGHDITVRVGEPDHHPAPLDDWLTGRWRAWTRIAGRRCAVPVHHEPWPLWHATVVDLQQSLLPAAGLPEPHGPPRVRHSPGVHSRLGLPRPV